MTTSNKYHRTITGIDGQRVTVDVYAVLVAFDVTCPAIAHAVKKLLAPGQRGHKDKGQDLREAVQSIERAAQMVVGEKSMTNHILPAHLTVENTSKIGTRVAVFLDGVEQKNVIEAHTGEGWLVRCKISDDGSALVDGDKIATERVNGTVTAKVIE